MKHEKKPLIQIAVRTAGAARIGMVLVFFLLMQSCGGDPYSWTGTQNSISGMIVPLNPVFSLTGHSPRRVSSVASLTGVCPTARANLFALDASGERILPAVQRAAVNADGSYQFANIRGNGIVVRKVNQLPEASYLVEVTGCNTAYARILTATDKQNIDWGSTLVAYVIGTPSASTAVGRTPASLENLYAALSGAGDFPTAYSMLSTTPAITNQFQQNFGAAPAILEDASPMLVDIAVPATMKEGESSPLVLNAVQWKAAYTRAYRWELDGVVIGNSATLNFTPSANSQGARTITVTWGQNDGAGDVDTLKPYRQRSFAVQISDDLVATPPLFAALPANVNSPSVNLRLQTGAGLANCASFTGLAVTEDNPFPPASLAAYTTTCSTAGTQDFAYTLTGGEGAHTLYLWAVDSAGNFSSVLRSAPVTYSSAFPNVVITSPTLASPPFQGAVTIAGSCETASGDLTLTGDIAGSPLLTACVAGSFSQGLSLSAGDGPKTIVAAQTNIFGSVGSDSIAVVRDSTKPTVLLSSASPTYTNGAVIAVQAVFSETVSGFTSALPVLTNATLTSFTGSGDTYTITVTASGQGPVNVTIPNDAGFDSAGNGNIGASLLRNYDSIAPSVSITTAAANPTNLASFPVTVTFSESVTGFALSDLSLTNGVASALTGSGASYGFTFTPAADGPLSIQVAAAAAIDPASNPSSASNVISLSYDGQAPTALLTTTVPSPTNLTPFPITLTFSENMTGFALSDLALSNGVASNLSGSGSTYTFDVTPSGQGLVEVALPAGSANDPATNGNLASNTLGRIFDSVPPNLTISSPAVGAGTNQNHLIFSGSCEGNLAINISGSGLSSPGSVTCASGSYSVDIFFTAGEGTKNITLTQADLVGNVATVSRAVPFDTVPPSITFTSAAVKDQITNTNTVTFTGACETGINVVVAGGVDTGSVPCSGAVWSYTTTSRGTDILRSYTFTQTDPGTNSASITGTWLRDTVAPALTRTAPADGTHAQDFVTITGACETGLDIFFTGSGILSPLQIACSGGTYSQAVFFTNGDGTKLITIRQTDLGSNATTINASFERDNVAPNLTQTLRASPYWTNSNSASFGGACETTGSSIAVTVDGVAEGSAPCSAGAWTYTVASQTTDATRAYAFTQVDTATNSTTVSAQWVRRTTNPVFTFTSANTFRTATNTVTFYGNCMSGVTVQVTGSDTSSTPCTGGAWSYTTAAQTTDATRPYTFRQTDPAGNFTQLTGSWERNTNLPQLTLATTTPFYSNGSSTTFTGGCSNGIAITLTGAESSTFACSSGAWSYTANKATDGNYTYTFTQDDGFGNATTVAMNWVRDTTPPTISSMSLNSGAAITNTSYVKTSLSGSDGASKVTKFCLKSSSPAPAANDARWIPVNASPPGLVPGPSLSLSNYSYLLGITPATYTVYAWLQDSAGNISTNAASAGVDQASIQYEIIYPPVLDTVFATNTSSPSFPVPSPQLSVGAGAMIYIKWRAAASNSTLGATPITLSFTTDDLSWSTIATVANAANGGCLLHSTAADAGTTGCYNWSAPTAGFIRVKIEVKDVGGRSLAINPPPINTGTFRLLAGNTESGINTSTLASVYRFKSQPYTDWSEAGTFVINSTGIVYINDIVNGIIKIDPADGLTKVLIPKTGISSADGPLATATVKNALSIALDYQDRLLVWDNDRIRRVDFTTNTVTRIIGGGTGANTTGTDTSASIANALDLQFEGYMPLPVEPDSEFNWRTIRVAMIPLPNGDLYFGSRLDPWVEAQYKFRRYVEASSTQITTTNPTGFGHSGGSGANLANCSINTMGIAFDPATSAITTVDINAADHGSSSTTSCMPDGSKGGLQELRVWDSVLDANFNAKAVQPPNGEVANAWAFYQRITGRNGKIYAIRRQSGSIYEFNDSTLVWTKIVGTGYQGQCADGTAALSCDLDLQDAFVSAQGQLFFLDHGRIRTLDGANKVVTLFGQSLSSGDGGDPVLARFNQLWSIALENDGRVLLYDENTLREVSADRSVVTKIAGNGRYDRWTPGQTALTSPLLAGVHWYRSLVLDPATNDIIMAMHDGANHAVMGRLKRSSGLWQQDFGAGSTPYNSADGLPGNQSLIGTYADATTSWIDGIRPLGFSTTGKLLTVASGYPTGGTGDWKNTMFKTYDSLDSWRQLHIAGRMGPMTSHSEFCDDGTDANSCSSSIHYRIARARYDATDKKWLLLSNGGDIFQSSRIRAMADNENNGATRTMQTLVTLPRIAMNFDYWRTGGHEYVYYCGDNGNLYRYDVTGGTETQLLLPSTSIKCLPQTALELDKANSVLYFNFQKNKLHAVGSINAI